MTKVIPTVGEKKLYQVPQATDTSFQIERLEATYSHGILHQGVKL